MKTKRHPNHLWSGDVNHHLCLYIPIQSMILRHTKHTHTLPERCLFWECIRAGFPLCTYWSLRVYLLLCVSCGSVFARACAFCPFPDHMSSTVPDIWWPYLWLRSLTVLPEPWEPCCCVGCSCMCVWQRERNDLRFGVNIFTACMQLNNMFW